MSENTICLYRGDSSKIEEFDVKRTDKYCLVGPGIYLTDNKDIAESYRTKGLSYQKRISGFVRPHKVLLGSSIEKNTRIDRSLAYKEAYDNFWMEIQEERRFVYGSRYIEEKRNSKKYKEEIKNLYKEYIAEGVVHSIYGYFGGKRQISVIYNRPLQNIRTNDYIGYITCFEFDKNTLESSIIPNDLYYRYNVWRGHPNESVVRELLSEYKNCTTYNLIMKYSPSLDEAVGLSYTTIKNVLQPYGIRGIEYHGGYVTGGVHHRAFCIWDDEYVNKHRVDRVK